MARPRPALWALWALWGLCLCLGLALGPAPVLGAQRARPLRARAPAALDQILGDGQPEDIGYGFQRSRAISRSVRSSRKDTSPKTPPQFALSAAAGDDPAVTKSMFRERMVRQRRQRQQQQQPTQQWGDWRHEAPSISSFYPPAGPNDPVEDPERYLQALREAWVRYQQQTGAIDVGPDDLTDLETLQFLEALGAGEDIPGARKRSSASSAAPGSGQYALYANAPAAADWSPDWSSPLAWGGYPLQKRSASYELQDDSGEWADGVADDGDGDIVGVEGREGGPVVPGSRLAALLSQQLFDERYDDPAVKRLLLAKRSAAADGASQQHKAQGSRADEEVPDGLQGRAMRRRKKSTRPALAAAQQQPMSQHDANVHKDLARIFGEPEPDGEPEPPLALPLVAGEVEPPLALPLTHGLVKRTAVAAPAGTAAPAAAPIASAAGGAAAATTKAAPAPTTTAPARKATTAAAGKSDAAPGVVAINPIGHAHETDKIAHEHHEQHLQHGAATAPPLANVQVNIHAEHAPPMVSAEGPHGHDTAVHAENKVEVKPGSPAGAGAGAAGGHTKLSLLEVEEPMYTDAARHSRRLAKKSIDWSQYFGLDRRRKKSLSYNDVDAPARIDPDWMMRHNLVGFRLLLPPGSKPSSINKRVAVKKEGASPDALLFGSWGRQGQGQGGWGWADGDGGEDDDGEDDDGEGGGGGGDVLGRCPAVLRLAETCRLAVGPNDGLLPVCVLYQACHLCGSAMGVPVGSSCESELVRRGAELCAYSSSPGAGRQECHSRVGAIVDLYRARQPTPDTETCAKQPCLAHFFLTAPAVAFSR